MYRGREDSPSRVSEERHGGYLVFSVLGSTLEMPDPRRAYDGADGGASLVRRINGWVT